MAGPPQPDAPAKGISRRDAVKGLFAMAAAVAATGCRKDIEALQAFFQKNFRELSPDEMKATVARWEKTYSQTYGQEVKVKTTPARPGELFGYALDVGRCIGCRRCVYACVDENNLSRDPQIQWITVLQMDKEKGIDLHHATPYYDPEQVPEEGKFYLPVACQHCENPPCVKVCPVSATWMEPDGIVVIDYDWCIGCRCCVTACPYGARHFNWGAPQLPAEDLNPNTHYLGNRPRSRGVVEKCTFCIHRVREGKYPACVEVCPVGARKFGNLLDPESEIRYILDHHRIFILKEELNTQPKFFYYFGV
jgi:molybdopterin-containing oxidoreductase family iron-sulfur binding subunit